MMAIILTGILGYTEVGDRIKTVKYWLHLAYTGTAGSAGALTLSPSRYCKYTGKS